MIVRVCVYTSELNSVTRAAHVPRAAAHVPRMAAHVPRVATHVLRAAAHAPRAAAHVPLRVFSDFLRQTKRFFDPVFAKIIYSTRRI